MDYYLFFGILAAIFQIGSAVPYVYGILYQNIKPNIVSQILWSIIGIIQIVALYQNGASWVILVLFAGLFNTTLNTILCLLGYGYKEYGKFDIFCFFLTLALIIFYLFTNNSFWTIIFSVLLYLFAFLPTLYKTYKYPETERILPWNMQLIANFFALISSNILLLLGGYNSLDRCVIFPKCVDKIVHI
jgi:uncharacterized protein with PQ loop repeat